MMEACSSGDLAAVLSILDGAEFTGGDDDAADHNGDGDDDSVDNVNGGIDDDDSYRVRLERPPPPPPPPTVEATATCVLLGTRRHLFASDQDATTGLSPLMVASRAGHVEICRALLDAGAPWNALDRSGKCAGDHAVDGERWDVVNLLVDAGTRSELILGASIRLSRGIDGGGTGWENDAVVTAPSSEDECATTTTTMTTTMTTPARAIPVSHEPSTKPSYLNHTNVRYDASCTLLLDDDDDAVMMEWERPIMEAHASVLTHGGRRGMRVLNVGFGLGIVDTALQSHEPSVHVIIEAHPTVHAKMIADGWGKRDGVRVCFGRWQDEMPKLIAEGAKFDGVFYDTYGEHFTDLEDFHDAMTRVLDVPNGVYSFFNGLAPDNLFFHGVACNCIKAQLSQMGLDAEFAQCEISSNAADVDETWEGVRRRYWHGRSTYYLPVITWKKNDT
jgi:protein arginine N-methyltransferase 2